MGNPAKVPRTINAAFGQSLFLDLKERWVAFKSPTGQYSAIVLVRASMILSESITGFYGLQILPRILCWSLGVLVAALMIVIDYRILWAPDTSHVNPLLEFLVF